MPKEDTQVLFIALNNLKIGKEGYKVTVFTPCLCSVVDDRTPLGCLV